MKTREEFAKLLIDYGLIDNGVELGTFKGDFASQILKEWPGKLYMVDIWRPLSKEEYDDISNHDNYIEVYKDVMENIKGFEDRAFMLRMKGEYAVNLFQDNSLDFVYIDANHTYECVYEDIELWYPKVKPGGIVAGHDYLKLDSFNKENYILGKKNLPIYTFSNNDTSNKTYAGMFGVNPAVEEFTEEHYYKFNVTDEFFATWWFQKQIK